MREQRYPWPQAWIVAEEICDRLRAGCSRIVIAGSLRRRRPDVGDIEILYIPVIYTAPDPKDLFAVQTVNSADIRIRAMEAGGILDRRLNFLGRQAYGPKNKLVRHIASGIPVDLFAATEENWFNYLVCRTGPADLNTRICMAAKEKGWKWNPYGAGYSNAAGEIQRMDSEAAVFSFVGMEYLEPERRK
jgi:DNA polymerase/3'-5' exonuclease PolX